MLILGRLHEDIQANAGSFALDQILTIVVEDIRAEGFPLLQGRALWLAAQFAEMLPDSLLSDSVMAAVHIMTNSKDTKDPRLVFAVKATKQFFCLTPEKLQSVVSHVIEALNCHFAGAKEEFLFLLLETMTLVVKVNTEHAARAEHILGPLILNVWSKVADGNEF
jgi:hypothetical protein